MSIPPTNIGNNEDLGLEIALRPKTWKEYVGQEKVKENLKLMISAAKERKEACDHLLFYGQAGLGKTTLAYLISQEMGMNVKSTSGPALEKVGDVAAILSNLERNDILFIDEVHRINKFVEEILYPAMETRCLHLVIGKGASAKTFSLDLPPFTMIAATTKVNLLSSPFRSRFGATFKLDYYEVGDMEKIVTRSAGILNIKPDPESVKIVSKASRFTPRVANRLLKRIRDYAQVHKKKTIDKETVLKTLAMLEIDHLGLEKTDRELLSVLINKFKGGPVGIKSLAAALNEEVGTVEDVYEPFLIKTGMIQRTPSGRVATPLAYEHVGHKMPGRLA